MISISGGVGFGMEISGDDKKIEVLFGAQAALTLSLSIAGFLNLNAFIDGGIEATVAFTDMAKYSKSRPTELVLVALYAIGLEMLGKSFSTDDNDKAAKLLEVR